jgi:protein-S-isoprenylcysteine O-methyltransferase Ste14
MNDVNRKAMIGLVRMVLLLPALVFLPAWTVHYWQGWACLFSFLVPATAISLYVATHDPALLERRLKAGASAEKEPGQKVVQTIAGVVFISEFVVPAIDSRLRWSSVPGYAEVCGDALMLIGFYIVYRVFKVNSFTSGIIEVAAGQKVVSTGPYASVRHPMYTGALIMLFGIPLALGSWWGLLINIAMTAAIVWRLLDEERFLIANLGGYQEYQRTVRYGLMPYVW